MHLMKSTFVANYDNIRTLVTSDHSLPQDWRDCLSQMAVEEPLREQVELLCRYALITSISFGFGGLRALTSLRQAVTESNLPIGCVFVEELAARNGDRGVPDTASPHSAHLAAGQLLPDRRIERSF